MLRESLGNPEAGTVLFEIVERIFPICRSITGEGVRRTLAALKDFVDLEIHEVPTGTQVFDWTVPKEWNIRDAYIKNSAGRRVVDFQRSNLHVVSYSRPVRESVALDELKKHLVTLPDQPDLIPYRTSYYSDAWGFCLSHNDFLELSDDRYEVLIDATLEDGSLTYGEYVHEGETAEEFLLSAHTCHPSMANDNCSGVALLAYLASRMRGLKTRCTYRFLFAPGTIGAITWLARNEIKASRIAHGLVVSCVGDGGRPTYKRSRQGSAVIDRAMAHIIGGADVGGEVLEFSPYGYDERQYCSPGFDLPVGLLQRSCFGKFPEYHTSADNLQFISPAGLGHSFGVVVDALAMIELNGYYKNLVAKCEPQLGRRGLYANMAGGRDGVIQNMAMLWVLNLSDGSHSLLDIAERADLPFMKVAEAAELLVAEGLLVPTPAPFHPTTLPVSRPDCAGAHGLFDCGLNQISSSV